MAEVRMSYSDHLSATGTVTPIYLVFVSLLTDLSTPTGHDERREGDEERRRRGEKETRREGDEERRRRGEKETRREGDEEKVQEFESVMVKQMSVGASERG